jgi:1-aminocyclopropane-1-carboxylate deaminase/D-cysteine desulfhydrase-like pyridoxal-dependent ACC family enzyme
MELTKLQYLPLQDIWVKREDLFKVAGCRGAKARACWAIATDPKNADKLKNGLVTAGSRKSPQINIVAHIAKELGVYCEAHTPQGELSTELLQAKELGAEIVQHRAGYNSVIKKRAKDRATELNALEIPFGMECQEGIEQTALQATSLRDVEINIKRIVLPIGSGINAAGLLCGLVRNNLNIPVVGIRVGADPIKILDKYAPLNWRGMMTIINATEDYHEEVKVSLGDIELDPVYEAKCVKFLQAGDLFWIIGKRNIIN